jgi:endoglucanase
MRRPAFLLGLVALLLCLAPGGPATGTSAAALDFLHVSTTGTGGKIVDSKGQEVFLKGVNFSGWLMYEDWLVKPPTLSFPLPAGQYQNEPNLSPVLDQHYGAGVGQMFFNGIRDNFITEDDFLQVAQLGGNVVRIPVAAWLFADGTGFRYLDQALTWAENSNVRVIIDMHAAPGCQTPSPFCLSSGTATDFWSTPAAQQQTLDLWTSIAARYSDRAVVAGYDILSEPAISKNPTQVPAASALQDFYTRLIAAIRAVDTRHILFVEGNGWALDLSIFASNGLGTIDSNTAYSLHLYRDEQCPSGADLEADILNFVLWQMSFVATHQRPVYVGEFGGSCDEWMTAAFDVLLRPDVNIRWATYFTWKSAAMDASVAGKPISGIVDDTAWTALLSKLSAGQSISTSDFTAGMAALRSSNFAPRAGAVAALERYFAVQPEETTATGGSSPPGGFHYLVLK